MPDICKRYVQHSLICEGSFIIESIRYLVFLVIWSTFFGQNRRPYTWHGVSFLNPYLVAFGNVGLSRVKVELLCLFWGSLFLSPHIPLTHSCRATHPTSPLPTKVARWQNLIPSLDCVPTPSTLAQSKEILQRSVVGPYSRSPKGQTYT